MAWVRAGLLEAACTASNKTNVSASAAREDLFPANVARNVQAHFREVLGVAAENIQITKVEMVTAGWLLTLNSQGQEYRYRIDETGTVVHQEP